MRSNPEQARCHLDRCRIHPRRRCGQSLVEFAVVAMVLYMLLAAILTFGHLLYVAQGLQAAADVTGREMSRTPFRAFTDSPVNAVTFEHVVDVNPGFEDNDKFRTTIFDEAYLVIDLDSFYAGPPFRPGLPNNIFIDLVPTLPLLNQQLVPLMITESILDNNGIARRVLRYPGALLDRNQPIQPPPGINYPDYVLREFAIGIPLVVSRSPGIPGGHPTVRWVPIIEEIDTEENAEDNTGANPDPFRVDSPQRGIVALRINYPFQSASMAGFRAPEVPPINPLPGPHGLSFEPTAGLPVSADDGQVVALNTPGNSSIRPALMAPLLRNVGGASVYSGVYAGQYGLGAQGAMGSQFFTAGRPVRPYRRVLSAQAIYRRELFQ